MSRFMHSGMLREAKRQLEGFCMNPDITLAMRGKEADQKPKQFPNAFIDGFTLCVPCRLAVYDDDYDRIGRSKWVNDGFPGCESLAEPVLYCALCRHIVRARELARQRSQGDSVEVVPPDWNLVTMEQGILIHEQGYDLDEAESGLLPSSAVRKDALVRSIPYRLANLQWLATCISDCEAKHGGTCGSPNFSWYDDDRQPLLLVDVRRQCLVKAPADSLYFTLSYVWGGAEQYATTSLSLQALMQPGGLTSKPLARTVRDAITLLQQLNEQYLWVDVLSIIQDDAETKQSEIDRMASTYSRSVATIVALSGDSAHSGLPGVGSTFRHTNSVPIAPGLRLVERTPLERALSDEATADDEVLSYNTRAWTFQERLLSTRALIFLPEQIVFQCREKLTAEDRHRDDAKYTRSAVFSLARAKLHSETNYRSNEYRTEGSKVYEAIDEFMHYQEVVGIYTSKKTTFAFDHLNAFIGVMTALTKLFGWKFTAGLPYGIDMLLDLALLWSPVEHLERGEEDLLFPSWSWAGWSGRIHYKDVYRPCYWGRDGDRTMPLWKIFRPCINIQLATLERQTPTLKFAAMWCEPNKFEMVDAGRQLHNPFCNTLVTSLVVFILDRSGVRCGILYGTSAKMLEAYQTNELRLILLSKWYRNSSMGRIRPIIGFWNNGDVHEEGLFDDTYAQEPWIIYNIMLIRQVGDHYERLAIGQIHRDAWGRDLAMNVLLG